LFKLVWITAALSAAFVASPAISDSPNWEAKRAAHKSKDLSGTLPAAILIGGMALVTVANRRRNLQRVLC
jgi:hypothetical protein